jgi:Ca2+/H+ antiporter, TMEM165/GDT1 family
VNVAIAATVFPIIFIGELPDKTMFASLVLATRGHPAAVFLGAALAFAVHVAIAVSAGTALVALLPHRALEAVVAVLFLAGAALAVREMRRGNGKGTEEPVTPGAEASAARAWATAFVVIFVAEWGDLTQILTANLAARYHSPVSVGVGSALALWAVIAIAIGGGRRLARIISVTLLRAGTAVVLTGFAAYAGWAAFS